MHSAVWLAPSLDFPVAQKRPTESARDPRPHFPTPAAARTHTMVLSQNSEHIEQAANVPDAPKMSAPNSQEIPAAAVVAPPVVDEPIAVEADNAAPAAEATEQPAAPAEKQKTAEAAPEESTSVEVLQPEATKVAGSDAAVVEEKAVADEEPAVTTEQQAAPKEGVNVQADSAGVKRAATDDESEAKIAKCDEQ